MNLEHKSFALAELKALGDDDEPGTIEALVAVFNNVDDYGDRILPGAFSRTLEERGLPYYVWSHDWQTVPIGVTKEAEETDEGLRIKARLFVADGEDHPVARQVYTAMRAQDGNGQPALREFSFGFQTLGSRYVEEEGIEIRELTDLELFEVGPTLVGVNPDTQLVGVKSLAKEISRAMGSQQDQPDDNPEPNSPEGDEEAKARIGRLALARPNHLA